MTKYQSLIERLYFIYKGYRYVFNFYQYEIKNKNSEYVRIIDFNSKDFFVFSNRKQNFNNFVDMPISEAINFYRLNLYFFRIQIKKIISDIRDYRKKYQNYKPFYFFQINGMLSEYHTYLFFLQRNKEFPYPKENSLNYYQRLVDKKKLLKDKK